MYKKYFRNLLLVIVLIFPSVSWSEVGDSYQCKDLDGEQLGGRSTDKFSFVFKWNSKKIKGSFFDTSTIIDYKILFQSRYEFISSKYHDEGRVTWTFNDYDLDGKGLLIRSYLENNYHYVQHSECFKVIL